MDEYGLLKMRGLYFSTGSKTHTEFNDYRLRYDVSSRPSAISEYSKTYKEYFELIDELYDAEKELNHLEAQSLWNES